MMFPTAARSWRRRRRAILELNYLSVILEREVGRRFAFAACAGAAIAGRMPRLELVT